MGLERSEDKQRPVVPGFGAAGEAPKYYLVEFRAAGGYGDGAILDVGLREIGVGGKIEVGQERAIGGEVCPGIKGDSRVVTSWEASILVRFLQPSNM